MLTQFFSNSKKTLLALLAMLVVVPYLLNTMSHIIEAFNELPIGNKERLNVQLFKVHWKEVPVHSKNIVIQAGGKKRQLIIDVYSNGNIFVDFGDHTQWFPFKTSQLTPDFSLIDSAYADYLVDGEIRDIDIVSMAKGEDEKGNKVITRIFSDGSVVKDVINPKSGIKESTTNTLETSDIDMIKDLPPTQSGNPEKVMVIETEDIE